MQSWRIAERWKNWVWVKQHPERWYRALKDCLPWQMEQLFKIKLLNVDGAFFEY